VLVYKREINRILYYGADIPEGISDCIFLLFAVVQSMACGPMLLYLQYAVLSFILRGGVEVEVCSYKEQYL